MRTILFALVILFCSIQLFAQKQMDPKMFEVIKSKKVAFITEQVGLTSKEGEKLWPVYNELEKERFSLMDKRRELEESTEDKTIKTDDYYKKLTLEIVSLHLKESKMIENYNNRFLSILPAEKVVKLYRSERKFRSYLMHEMRKNDDDNSDKKSEKKIEKK